ncbi:MAG: SDR family NAD(P)-dependent oxidoreductase [Bryobacteraceae bacterium]
MSGFPTVIITGASGGLGATVTGVFRGAGFRVAAVARRWNEGASDSDFVPISADLTSRAGAELAVMQGLAALGGIDALVHLAGGFRGGANIEDTSDAVWDAMLDLNLKSAVHLLRAAIPVMRAQGRGRVVMVGSRAAVDPSPGLSAYAASKAALLSLAQTAAAELRDSGVTVNALLPSTIDTPANREAMGEEQASRWVQPASLASLILWLCSDAGRDVTGAAIPVYGRV